MPRNPSSPDEMKAESVWRNRIVGHADVSPHDLVPHEANWRTHPRNQQAALKGVLGEVGIVQSVIVSKRTGKILDGHLRAKLAAQEGQPTIPVVYVDVSEAEEKKIIATLDAVGSLAGMDGTAFESLMNDITTNSPAIMEMLDDLASEAGLALGAEPDEVELDEMAEDLSGAITLKPDLIFDSHLKWDIPPLREDRLADLPAETIKTWAGPDASMDDGESWFFYVWGSDSTRGMPFDRSILGFYTNDERFDKFFYQPNKYTAKLINAGIPIALSPNYSLWGRAPRALHLFNIFRSRYVGRYFQEAGINVIPDIAWSDERSFDYCLLGVPKNPPCVSLQLQTQDLKDNPAAQKIKRDGLAHIRDELSPQRYLVYGGPDAKALIDTVDLGAPVTFVLNRTAIRRPIMERRKRNA